MRPAIFLDRDNTILATGEATAGTPHEGDLTDPSQVRFVSGAIEACALLARTGLQLVVLSNQGAVARGRCTVRDVERVNDRMRAVLLERGVRLAGVYVCPFHPHGTTPPFNVEHPWRKPDTGMYLAAAKDLAIDLSNSWAIGDSQRDVLSAVTAGIASARSVMIGKGPGLWYPDLFAAAKVIVAALENHIELLRGLSGAAAGGRAAEHG